MPRTPIRRTNDPRACLSAFLSMAWIAAFTITPVAAWGQSADAPATEAPAAAPTETAPTGAAPVEGAVPVAADGAIDPAVDPLADPDGLLAAENAMLPRDLSPWGMFLQADWVVKAVMIGLAFASVVTWTVWLAKSLELAAAKRRSRQVLRTLQAAGSLDDAVGANARQRGAAAALVQAADHELTLSAGLDAPGIKERIESVFERILHAAARQAGLGTGLLATIGATAPFVGLFGTVWGIMNSFIGISKSQTTNLAVVAPGIAEALLATAIGLVAAIPAVIIYNHFARVTKGYLELVNRASGAAGRLLSRDLDRTHVSSGQRSRGAAE
jgi:biopolymer transport protein ExbB